MQARTGGNRGNTEEELTSKTLQIQNKRFYLDVKKNQRGKFVKIAEVGLGGRKSRILMSMSTAGAIRDVLNTMVASYDKLKPNTNERITGNGLIRSETVTKDIRRYYLDLKENNRGRFLRVAMISPTSRSQIAIPGKGIVEVRDCLEELLKEHGIEDEEDVDAKLPDPKSLRTDNKMFYFDVGSNHRGVFLRISEVRASYRTAVTVPERSWTKFRDIINEMIEKMTPGDENHDSSVAKKEPKKSNKAGEKATVGAVAGGDTVSAAN